MHELVLDARAVRSDFAKVHFLGEGALRWKQHVAIQSLILDSDTPRQQIQDRGFVSKLELGLGAKAGKRITGSLHQQAHPIDQIH